MTAAAPLRSLNRFAARVAARVEDVLLLALRVYVSWQFLKSGWLKLQDWETTRFLFEEEYRVPLLSPAVAAALGTAGELVFPLALTIGLLGRYAAVGLWCVNALAVVAYAHVLFAEGFEAAVAQHYLWGVLLVTLAVFGPGRVSLDGWLDRGDGNVRRGGAR
jgi:putative oxidoreductase